MPQPPPDPFPIDAPGLPQGMPSEDPLAHISVETFSADDVFAHVKLDEGRSEVISARIPAAWMTLITELRQDPKIPFRVVSEFLRSAVFHEIQLSQSWLRKARQQDGESDNYDHDPMIDAHLFSEQHLGRVTARTAIIEKVNARVAEIASAIDLLMQADEPAEAADIISQYVGGAISKTNDFWKRFFVKALFTDVELSKYIAILIQKNYLQIDYLTQAALAFGALSTAPPQPVDSNPDDDFIFDPSNPFIS